MCERGQPTLGLVFSSRSLQPICQPCTMREFCNQKHLLYLCQCALLNANLSEHKKTHFRIQCAEFYTSRRWPIILPKTDSQTISKSSCLYLILRILVTSNSQKPSQASFSPFFWHKGKTSSKQEENTGCFLSCPCEMSFLSISSDMIEHGCTEGGSGWCGTVFTSTTSPWAPLPPVSVRALGPLIDV